MVRATDDKLVVQRARKILIPTSTFTLGALEVFTPVICCESAFLHPETAFLLHKIVVQHGR